METVFIKEEANDTPEECLQASPGECDSKDWSVLPGPLCTDPLNIQQLDAYGSKMLSKKEGITSDSVANFIKEDLDTVVKEEFDPDDQAVEVKDEDIEFKISTEDHDAIAQVLSKERGSQSSELRFIRKELCVKCEAHPSINYQTTIVPELITISPSTAKSLTAAGRKVPLTEKASVLPSLASQLREISSQKVSTFCPYCQYSTSDDSKLKKHIATHKESNMELFSCLICSFTTIYRYQLKTHTAKHSAELGRHICQYCKFTSNNRHDLILHVASHETLETFVCNWCSYTTTHKASFNKHFAKHGRPCPVCGYISFDKADMEQHCEGHLVESQPCEVEAGKIHHVENGGSITIPASQCKSSTNSDASVEGSIKCSSCSFTTNHEADLKRHSLVTHSERIVRSFTLCTSTPRYSNEDYDKSIFDEDDSASAGHRNKFMCKMCDYSSTSRHHMDRHMVTHTGCVKVLKCPYCCHKTRDRLVLRKHITTKHRGKPFRITNVKEQIAKHKSL